jgi:hypothetical protein
VSKPIEIDGADLRNVVRLALENYKETKYLPDDPKEVQAFLFLTGLRSFLISKGIEPQFTVKPVRREPDDGTPLDDM